MVLKKVMPRPVIPRDPTIIGRTPYSPDDGSQVLPNMNLKNPTLSIEGKPSLNMKIIIKRIIIIEERAVIKRPFSIRNSSILSFI